jgi:protoporphyrinogen/coproporphyrinogen III oxidase
MRAVKATVVGGGIAGLAAALRLHRADIEVDLFEGSDRLGGKLHTSGGLEAGAEAFLMRDPAGGPSAAVRLIEELGLGGQIVHPTGLPPGLFVNGALTKLPGGTLLGIPGPQTDLTGVATLAGSDVDNGRPVLDADTAVGALVRQRFGGEIVTKLVDPLLGGVYAGRADELSIAATMPGLFRWLLVEPTLSTAVKRAIDASKAHSGGPVFGTVAGGLSRVIEAAAKELEGRIHLRRFARELPPTPTVLAVPGPKVARLLPPHDLGELSRLEYASVALVTFEFPDAACADLPDVSGFLVPESEGLSIKAATFFSKKWEHIGGCVVRVSLGRAGDAATLQAPDEALAKTALDNLSKVVGRLPAPRSVKLNRWGGGLPQYPPNHIDHVQEARERLRDRPIALAGAAFDGVGIPACAKSGIHAAELLLERWMA